METGSRTVGQPGIDRWLWGIAVLTFGVADVVSTVAGLSVGGVEANPVVDAAVQEYGLLAMVPIKITVLGGCYLAWLAAPAGYRSSVPVALSTVGAATTGWNIAVLSVVVTV